MFRLTSSPVPVALQVGTLGLVQEQLYLLAGENLGQLLLRALDGDVVDRVLLHGPDALQVVVEAFEGGHEPRHSGGGFPCPPAPGDISADDLLGGVGHPDPQINSQIIRKLVYIPDIGEIGIVGHLLHVQEISLKALNIILFWQHGHLLSSKVYGKMGSSKKSDPKRALSPAEISRSSRSTARNRSNALPE